MQLAFLIHKVLQLILDKSQEANLIINNSLIFKAILKKILKYQVSVKIK